MATAPFRPDLVEYYLQTDDDVHRMAREMHETVIVTREMIRVSRARMQQTDCLLETDRLLKQR